ncbi:hypothetical protein DTO96_102418 [Ephemeroptericola cinctiostellae]|uniref:Uncharacterized protein n=1 Tax=Ephemeroptericola cinctiostellae TaxID=2268024 RepID=A0A345DE75_9BURK|nr:hypothetical protein [Ephemeroptericola cinctiostellae]AXF86663.1 hypothetical protein DTO96_102418 [Ephemeroptericola cinctiostellae]
MIDLRAIFYALEAVLVFAHFYAGMSLYKRASAMLAVDGWVRAAAVDGGRFFVTLSPLGVLQVVTRRGAREGTYLRLERRACEGGCLVGVYRGVGESVGGVGVSDVMDDVSDALIRAGL